MELTAVLVVIPGSGDLPVTGPGASPVSVTAPQQCHGQQPPGAPNGPSRGCHSLLGSHTACWSRHSGVCSSLTITEAVPPGREPKIPSLPTSHRSASLQRGVKGKTPYSRFRQVWADCSGLAGGKTQVSKTSNFANTAVLLFLIVLWPAFC